VISRIDVLAVAAITALAGACGFAVGALALRAVRRRPLQSALRVVALTSAVVVAVSVAITGAVMLVSGHALAVLVTSVILAAVAGLGVASLLGRQVARGSADLRSAIRRVGAAEPPGELDHPPPVEFAALADELAIAHERLAEARSRERALEASRRELVSWISHDLRTPLAGIRAMAEALEDGVVSDKASVAAYYRGLRIESDRLARMVDELFELSRLQAGSMPREPRVMDLRVIADEVVAGAAPVARARGIELVPDVASPAPALVDRAQLVRATGNLLSNALRYGPESSRVTVSVGRDGNDSYIAVSDECGGIATEHLPRLFDVGYRAEHARTPDSDAGAGLGLAITRGIAEANGGTVGVDNVGPGCRFTLRLPAATSAPSLPTTPPAATREQAGAVD
jgi:signal transduction histidine kinase